MPSPERFSFGELLASIFRDPWRKLVSLVLAVLLWHYLDAQVSDSDDLGLALFAAHNAGDLDTSQEARLFVRLDKNTYGVIGYEDAATGQPRDSVVLQVTGAKRLIQTLDENQGFAVDIEPVSEQGELIATFGGQNVRPVNPRFEGLEVRMEPSRVRVRIGLNIERSVILRRDRLDIAAPPNAAGLLERLVWDDARFQPELVRIRGPQPIVERLADQGKLFRFNVEPPAPGTAKIEAALGSTVTAPGVTVEPDTVALRVPVKIDPRTFVLPDVPVVLREPESVRDRFQLRTKTADVEIEAFRTLDGKLSGLRPDELRRWVLENDVYLVASVPRDAVEPDFITNPRLVIRDYYERTDYRMTVPPTIHFDPKDQ